MPATHSAARSRSRVALAEERPSTPKCLFGSVDVHPGLIWLIRHQHPHRRTAWLPAVRGIARCRQHVPAQAPLVIVVRRACATRRTGEQWRHHDRHGEVAGRSRGFRGTRRWAASAEPAQDSRQPPGCSFLRRRTASEEGPAGRGPAPEGAVSAEIPPYAALATPGQENRGPKDGG